MELMPRRSNSKYNTLPSMAQLNSQCVSSMSMGMCSLHAHTKRQMCTPRFTHGEVCIHRIPQQIQRMEVLCSIHTSHHHIGKAEFNEGFFLMRGTQNPKMSASPSVNIEHVDTE